MKVGSRDNKVRYRCSIKPFRMQLPGNWFTYQCEKVTVGVAGGRTCGNDRAGANDPIVVVGKLGIKEEQTPCPIYHIIYKRVVSNHPSTILKRAR